jgi:hypothetical protein
MGKRSNFERREIDFYPTPRVAVVSLIPHLRGIHSFAEPCAGDGALVGHLEEFGLQCVYSGDIRTGQDELALDYYGTADCIVSNPPYTRPLVHALIWHFARILRTWQLIDYDWSATKQATPFMTCCSDIVILPLKWFEGSKNTGKDNHAYKFDTRHSRGPVLHNNRGQGEVIPRRTRVCEQSRRSYEPQRSSSRFCSGTRRQRAHRNRLSVTPAPSDSSETFRYVRHAEVPRFTAEGWELLPALDGTHHGEYSALLPR